MSAKARRSRRKKWRSGWYPGKVMPLPPIHGPITFEEYLRVLAYSDLFKSMYFRVTPTDLIPVFRGLDWTR